MNAELVVDPSQSVDLAPKRIRQTEYISPKDRFDQIVEENIFSKEYMAQIRASVDAYDDLSKSLDDNQRSFLTPRKKVIKQIIQQQINENDSFVRLSRLVQDNPDLEGYFDVFIDSFKRRLSLTSQEYQELYVEKNNNNIANNHESSNDPESQNNTEQDQSQIDYLTSNVNQSSSGMATSAIVPLSMSMTTGNEITDSILNQSQNHRAITPVEPNLQRQVEHHNTSENQRSLTIESGFDPEIIRKLEEARQQYAHQIAKMRYKRLLMGFGSQQLDDLSKKYQDTLDQLVNNLTNDEKQSILAQESLKLHETVYDEKAKLEPKNRFIKKFYKWMRETDPDKNQSLEKIKRSLVVGGLALGLGFAAGTIVTTIGAGALATASTAALSRGSVMIFSKRKFSSSETTTNQTTPSQPANSQELVDQTNQSTRESVKNNRKASAKLIGGVLVMSLIGAEMGHLATSHVPAGHEVSQTKSSKPELPMPDKHLTSLVVKEVPMGGAQYPWDYFAQHFGADKATDMIENLAQKAQAAGWKVNSFPRGIYSIVDPNGIVYNTTQGIVSALLHFN